MKKYVLFLVLLTLCLSLVACEQSPQAQASERFGTLYMMLEESRYAEAMDYVAALNNGNKVEENQSAVSKAVAKKYADLGIELLDKDYSTAAKIVAAQAYEYFNQEVWGKSNPLAEYLFCGWYESMDNPDFTEEPLTFRQDGTAVTNRHDQQLLWVVESHSDSQLKLRTFVAESLKDAGTVTISFNERCVGMVYNFKDLKDNDIFLNYFCDLLLTGAYSEWYTAEQQDLFPAELSIEGIHVLIQDVYYPLAQIPGSMQVLSEDGTVLYTMCLNESGEHLCLELWKGEQVCKYYLPGDEISA